MNDETVSAPEPWYRDRWPWLIISIPAISAVLGIVMLVLAIRSHDGLVAEDYYKQGMAINEVLDKEVRAQRLHIRAEMSVEEGRVRVLLKGEQGNAGALILKMVHPTRAGEDQELRLRLVAPDTYEAIWPSLGEGRWRAMLEDEAGAWRIKASWRSDQTKVAFYAGE